MALSLADRTTDKQTNCSSLTLCKFLTKVKRRTQWGSVLGSENLSTQIHVEKLKPVCGGNNRSPTKKHKN